MAIWTRSQGGYLYLSHAYEERNKAIKLRNKIEELGFEPLFFDLKGIHGNNAKDLLAQEVRAHQWFLTPLNPPASPQAQLELEIAKQANKTIIHYKLEEDKDEIFAYLLMNCLRVYLLYAPQDQTIAEQIKDTILSLDLMVYDQPIYQEENSDKQIDEACFMGVLCPIISIHSLKTPAIRKEITYALSKQTNVVPIVIGKGIDLMSPFVRFTNSDDLPAVKQAVEQAVLAKLQAFGLF